MEIVKRAKISNRHSLFPSASYFFLPENGFFVSLTATIHVISTLNINNKNLLLSFSGVGANGQHFWHFPHRRRKFNIKLPEKNVEGNHKSISNSRILLLSWGAHVGTAMESTKPIDIVEYNRRVKEAKFYCYKRLRLRQSHQAQAWILENRGIFSFDFYNSSFSVPLRSLSFYSDAMKMIWELSFEAFYRCAWVAVVLALRHKKNICHFSQKFLPAFAQLLHADFFLCSTPNEPYTLLINFQLINLFPALCILWTVGKGRKIGCIDWPHIHTARASATSGRRKAYKKRLEMKNCGNNGVFLFSLISCSCS